MKIKNILTALLAGAVIVGAMTVSALAENFEISEVEELISFAEAVNGGKTYEGDTVTLTADINLEGLNWTPIGNDVNYFMGTFDGGENTISNMTVDIESDGSVFAGLFGGIKKATIKNLEMENVKIDVVGGKVRAAAIAGLAHSNNENRTDSTINFENITISGCEISAESLSNTSVVMVGGIAGYCYPANMSDISVSDITIDVASVNKEVNVSAVVGYLCGQNISNNGGTRAYMSFTDIDLENVDINADAYSALAGGLLGRTYYGYLTLEDCEMNDIAIDVDAYEAFVGSITGYFHRSDIGNNISNVEVTGIDFDVTTDYLGETRVGGMVGTSQSVVTFTDCSVEGTIKEQCSDPENPVNYHAKAGGFVGRAYTWANTFENCVADVDVTGSNVAGGFIANHITSASYTNCEAKGDVTANIAGGFVGRLTENTYSAAVTFDGCKSSGDVTGTNVAGGFIGSTADHGWNAWKDGSGTPYAKNITLKDCIISGNVTSGTDYEAGIIGEARVTDGTEITFDNVLYNVEPKVYPSDTPVKYTVATVGGESFLSLDEAISEAIESGKPVELVDDVILAEAVVIDGNVTINGNGYTVKSPDLPGREPFAPIKVTNGAEVTFEDITVIGGNCADENGAVADGYAASAIEVDGATINVINSELIGGDSTGMSMDSPGSAISAIKSSNVSVSDSTLTNGKTNDCPSPVIRIDNTSNLSVHNVVFNFNKSENAYYYNEEVSVIDGSAGEDHTNPVMMSGIISVFGRALDRVAIVIPEGKTLQFRGNIDAGYLADEIEVVYEKVNQEAAEEEQSDLYNIVLKSTKNITFTSDYSEPVVTETKRFINRLNSADLTFKLTSNDAMKYEIIASNSDIKINPVNNSDDRYEFHFDGKDDGVVDTASEIIIGQVKVSGYGTYSFTIDGEAVDKAGDKTTVVHATESADSIVETFIPDGDVNAGQGKLVLGDGIIGAYIAVPTRNLVINIDFPNTINNNDAAYQNMTVTVSGGDLAEAIEIALGADAVETAITGNNNKVTAKYLASFVDGAYVVTLTDILTVNTSYNVTVSGAGYRTARYTVTMTEDKTLNFWNNVKDNETAIEEGKKTAKVTYLAGDIVKDNLINIYDLSAVVSYFGEVELNTTGEYNAYAKYDLNRDGKIDSRDVAYVLVSWNN